MSGATVIVPNWNRRELLRRLLESLKRQTQPADEVLVVDNGSEDGSAAMAAGEGARVIQMGWNSGFCRAVNRGIQEARTPWLAVVNNDVEPDRDWLAQLMAAPARQPGTQFVTGKLLSAKRRDLIDGSYDAICRGGCPWRVGHGRPDGTEWDAPRIIRFAPFTAALFRAELFEKVGLLDERFHSFLEDVDFGLRCAMKGYEGIYIPEAVAYHAGSASLGEWHADAVRLIARNQLLLVAKHYPKKWVLRYGWAVFAAQSLWGLLALRHGAGLAFLLGKMDGLRQAGAMRRPTAGNTEGPDQERLGTILEESERELLELQQRTGFDFYWRLYFALT